MLLVPKCGTTSSCVVITCGRELQAELHHRNDYNWQDLDTEFNENEVVNSLIVKEAKATSRSTDINKIREASLYII